MPLGSQIDSLERMPIPPRPHPLSLAFWRRSNLFRLFQWLWRLRGHRGRWRHAKERSRYVLWCCRDWGRHHPLAGPTPRLSGSLSHQASSS